METTSMQRKSVRIDDEVTSVASDDMTDAPRRLSKQDSGTSSWRSLVVMECGNNVPAETSDWLFSKLTRKRKEGGGELLVRRLKSQQNDGGTIFHVAATTERLLVAAELMELKKPYRDGSLREISMADIEQFKDSDDLDEFLSMSEKQMIIEHEILSIRAQSDENTVVGSPHVELYEGEAIIPVCQKEDIVTQLFPLHDKAVLKELGTEWYRQALSPQPLNKVQKYFGETIAMYFAFLGFYTMALIPPAVIGILSSFSGQENMNTQIFFSIFNLVWVSVFLETWKRNRSSLAYSWGTLGMEQFEEARPEFHGTVGRNVVTGNKEHTYPKWKRMTKFYCVSLPTVFFCLYLGFEVMLLYFWLQEKADRFHARHENYFSMAILLMPTVVYAILISVMNAAYRKLAKALNDWENHRLESAYENHLITKLVMFDFVNCFMSLFYVAFYMQDMNLLRSHLATLLITQQVIGQVREAIIPYLMYKKRKKQIMEERAAAKNNSTEGTGGEAVEDVDSSGLSEEDRTLAMIERSREKYDGTLDDYLEMFLQFGYVFLFSAVFPSAAFWALLNNITEIRSDAFKLCRIFQRPFPAQTSGIGAWQVAFEVMSVMAVVTNTALVALTPQVQEYVPVHGMVKVVLAFVIAEHVILSIKFLISYLIPDEPEWVETALARVEYESKQALRKEKITQAKQQYRRKASRIIPPVISRESGYAEQSAPDMGSTEAVETQTSEELPEVELLPQAEQEDTTPLLEPEAVPEGASSDGTCTMESQATA